MEVLYNEKIIYKWAIFHGYVSHNQRVDFADRRDWGSWPSAAWQKIGRWQDKNVQQQNHAREMEAWITLKGWREMGCVLCFLHELGMKQKESNIHSMVASILLFLSQACVDHLKSAQKELSVDMLLHICTYRWFLNTMVDVSYNMRSHDFMRAFLHFVGRNMFFTDGIFKCSQCSLLPRAFLCWVHLSSSQEFPMFRQPVPFRWLRWALFKTLAGWWW